MPRIEGGSPRTQGDGHHAVRAAREAIASTGMSTSVRDGHRDGSSGSISRRTFAGSWSPKARTTSSRLMTRSLHDLERVGNSPRCEVVEHVLVQQVGLVDEQDGVDLFSAEALGVAVDSVEDGCCRSFWRQVTRQADVTVEVVP